MVFEELDVPTGGLELDVEGAPLGNLGKKGRVGVGAVHGALGIVGVHPGLEVHHLLDHVDETRGQLLRLRELGHQHVVQVGKLLVVVIGEALFRVRFPGRIGGNDGLAEGIVYNAAHGLHSLVDTRPFELDVILEKDRKLVLVIQPHTQKFLVHRLHFAVGTAVFLA